jgi:hypothetical protein
MPAKPRKLVICVPIWLPNPEILAANAVRFEVRVLIMSLDAKGGFDMSNRIVGSLVAAVIAVCLLVLVPLSAAAQEAAARVPGYENMKPLGPDGRVIPRKEIPRTADGKPDFTGVWAGPGFSHRVGPNDTDTPTVSRFDEKKITPLKPGGQTFMYRPITGDTLQDDPTAYCLPNGMPRQILSPYSQQWIQAPGTLVILYEYMHFFRTIPTDGRPHRKDVESTWMGDSVAKWDGDTLVIDTIGLKEWVLDAFHENASRWHSDQLHLIERIRYIDPMTATYEITIDDPKIFTAPWKQDFQMKLHPTLNVYEFVCDENNRCRDGSCRPAEAQK